MEPAFILQRFFFYFLSAQQTSSQLSFKLLNGARNDAKIDGFNFRQNLYFAKVYTGSVRSIDCDCDFFSFALLRFGSSIKQYET